jgi:hypothetical protein
MFLKVVLTQGIYPVSLPSLYCLHDIPFLFDTMHFFISQTNDPFLSSTTLQTTPGITQPLSEHLNISSTQGYVTNVWHNFILKFQVQFAGEKGS